MKRFLLSIYGFVLLVHLPACGGAVSDEPAPSLDAGADAKDASVGLRRPRAGPTPADLCRNYQTRGEVVGLCRTDGKSCSCDLAYGRGLKNCEKDEDCPLPQPCFFVDPQACYDFGCDGPGYAPFGICW